jgi:phosphopantothenoylcysteine decarboxylase / phosphopantothenate---cysteine ligase
VANVVVGVTGGIAAYKSAPLIRLFSEAGHSVQVVATENAFKFIGKTTLEALSKNPVHYVDPDLFTDVDQVKHIALAKAADLIVVAPATASFLAKIAAGIADDLLTTTVLAATAPVVLAPAMHTEMWENQATRENLSVLRSRGFHIVDPGSGRLTGEDTGVGRLADPEEIFQSSLLLLGGQPLSGVRICITTGGTREPIDAARFIGNFSSGKQGLAFAEQAKLLGAEVFVIAANLTKEQLTSFEHVIVQSTAELSNELEAKRDWFDVLIMSAAVSDYKPASAFSGKIKRNEQGESLSLELVANPDILMMTNQALVRSGRNVTSVGFAAEASSDLEAMARKKLVSKGCDFIVANDVSDGAIFGKDQTDILLVDKHTAKKISGSKSAVAREVLEVVAARLGKL